MTCNHYQDWMVEALYGELDDVRRAEFDSHIALCAECAGLFAELQSTADVMSRRRRPDPGPEFWDGFGRRLEARLVREDSVVDASRFARRRSLGSWGYRVAAVVALLAAGAWIGRTVLSPAPATDMPRIATVQDSTPRTAPDRAPAIDDDSQVASEVNDTPAPIDAPPAVRESTADTAPDESRAQLVSTDDDARRYIERSQLLLLAVVNADPDDDAAFASQRERAGELVRLASSVREGSDDRRVRDLVAQLEFILREIAHLDETSDVEAVEVIRNRVDKEGVLLRINLHQMRATTDTPAQPGGAID